MSRLARVVRKVATVFRADDAKQTVVYEDPTVAEGWETYARNYAKSEGAPLGEEWNEPDVIGIDVAADQIVSYLDKELFSPFLGTCEVMLEIGSGGGRFTEVLLPKCRRLLACDTSATMLKMIRHRFADQNHLECVQLEGTGLGMIPSASVDCAFSFDVFVHLQHWDIFNYLQEIRRVLRPGGRALIHHSNTFSELGWRKFVEEVPISVNRHKLFGSLILMSPELMRMLAERAGLVPEAGVTDLVKRDCITLLRAPEH